MHPRWLRCFSFEYSRYAHSSCLAKPDRGFHARALGATSDFHHGPLAERAELDALAERTAQAERCVPTDRAIWPDVCEARMSRNVTTLKRLVAALGRR